MQTKEFFLDEHSLVVLMASRALFEKITFTIDQFYTTEGHSPSASISVDDLKPLIEAELGFNDWSSEIELFSLQDAADLISTAVFQEALEFICPAAKHIGMKLRLMTYELLDTSEHDDSRAFALADLCQRVEDDKIPQYAYHQKAFGGAGILVRDVAAPISKTRFEREVLQVITGNPTTTSLLSWAIQNAASILRYGPIMDKFSFYERLAVAANDAIALNDSPNDVLYNFFNGLHNLRKELWRLNRDEQARNIQTVLTWVEGPQ